MTDAHLQKETHRYVVNFPAHEPRTEDPHYHAFNEYRKTHVATAKCYVGQRVGFDECEGTLELHHHFLEFAVINEVYLAALEVDFPEIDTPEKAASWAETDGNFMWLCSRHHRGPGGAHNATFADFSAEEYVRDLIQDGK